MIKKKQNIQRNFLNLGVIDPKNNFKNECIKILSLLHKNFSLGKKYIQNRKAIY